jgi:hypothetical protein
VTKFHLKPLPLLAQKNLAVKTVLTLAENPQEALTNSLWEKWKTAGYTDQPHALTWMDVNNLAKYYLKTCREAGADYRDFDFETLVDHTLNYYENTSMIVNAIGQPQEATEQAALAEINNHLSENYGITIDKKLRPHSELEQTVKTLEAKIRDLTAENSGLSEQLKVKPKEVVKTVQVEVVKEVPITKEVIREVHIPNPEQYTQAELIEIIDYLIQRKKQRSAGSKLTAKTVKVLKGAYHVAHSILI